MERVYTQDGTPIAYHRIGQGTPLVLVPGTGAANPLAWPASQTLKQHFSLCAVDRRGHGDSGDGKDYSLQREAEDIAAIVDALGEPVYLLGHSFGALCVLEAALLTHNVSRLVLYEPAIPQPGIALYPRGFIDQMEASLEASDQEGVLRTLYREIGGLSQQEFEEMRLSPAWPERLAAAKTVPRELRVEQEYRFKAQRFMILSTPTQLLTGSESPPMLRASTETLSLALPNSRTFMFLGEGHIAMYTAPDLFVEAIVPFLGEV
jgi:pimeloyl-ACP methyl ester carboxylesterase